MPTFLAGFTLSFSLILAIGSQNAFVLKQGLKNQHIFFVCAACAISDAILILAGVAGFGAMIEQFPSIELFARYGGALFLLVYSFLSFKTAFTADHALRPQGDTQGSLPKVILMCLAFTWLNPHVYLDTVVLLGSISTQYAPRQFVFAGGAMTASIVFFFCLGYGARFLTPLFENPKAWKVLEIIVGLTMLLIALSLIYKS